MASKQPIVRQINYIALLPQLVFLAFLIFIFSILGIGDPTTLGIIIYLIIALVVRRFIPRNQRRGISYVKSKEYDKALNEFENSYKFFTKYRWIDKYRFIVLLSSSRISYMEMALANMAFCHSQLGNGLKAKELYERTLKEYPDSQIAIAALKMFDAVKNINIEENS